MWQSWVLALVGGKRSRDDASLEATLRREPAEETPSLEPTDLTPFAGSDERRRPDGSPQRLLPALER
ncbi:MULTISPECIES: NUDIX domain-containing protein [unclassified Streptomyces]|uniref:NUDIX domain-containing protein n=1 Tax=unclassified Streptomyces TaxID=2593676 RepID=UPI0033D29534